jgi:micrococcal nuclease
MVALVLVLASGCQGLDSVPVLAGYHCAEERADVQVACVLDGDTVQVGECGGESVRLLGINAPEIAHNESETAECWGPEAQSWMTDLLTDQTVRLTFDTTCTDMYGRTLAYVWLPDPDGGTDDVLVNERAVLAGQARVFEDFDDIRLADWLYSAQNTAKDADVGLWGACE